MINLKRFATLSLCVFTYFFCNVVVSGQENTTQARPRVVKTISSRPLNQPPAPASQSTVPSRVQQQNSSSGSKIQRTILTNEINVARPEPVLVKKTGDSSPLTAAVNAAARRSVYSSLVSDDILRAIDSRIGIPYRWGATGPKSYDCSGFVWAVFNEAGLKFTRQSARNIWSVSEPVTGEDRFKFGTLVFFNKLGHIGIVADENGFYHASRSKGITYSPFKGYWEKRIVGFRRLIPPAAEAEK